MERRQFLKHLIGGVAAVAAVRTFPFRVYSFGAIPPKKVYSFRDVTINWTTFQNDLAATAQIPTRYLFPNPTLEDVIKIPGVDWIKENDFMSIDVGLSKDLDSCYIAEIKSQVDNIRPIGLLVNYPDSPKVTLGIGETNEKVFRNGSIFDIGYYSNPRSESPSFGRLPKSTKGGLPAKSKSYSS